MNTLLTAKLRLLVALGLLTGAGTHLHGGTPDLPPARPPLLPPADLKNLTSEVIGALTQDGLLTPTNPQTQRAVLQALVGVVGGGARYVPANAAEQAAPVAPGAVPADALGAPVRLRDTVLFIALYRVDADTAAALANHLTLTGKQEKFAGLVLDLRHADAGTLTGVGLAVTVLEQQAPMLTLLTSELTCGAPEVLAAVAHAKLGATLVGRPTRGNCSELRARPLASGGSLLLPVPVTEFAGITMPTGPLQPDIEGESLPTRETVAGLTQERFEAFPERDRSLLKAVDLMIVANALKNRQF